MSIPESQLSYGSILTQTGENAEINGKLNSKPISFTHIAIGDANDAYVQPSRTQTTLVNEITRIPVTGMEKIVPSTPEGIPQLKVWAKVPDNIVDVAVREFAAVATFDGNSYLHAVGNSVRIPILSGSNNGGEVNDIFIEMTFAVTSLEPIVMIDPTIVTATRKFVEEKIKSHEDKADPHPQYATEQEVNALIENSQFQPWNDKKTYRTGDVCTRFINGEVKAMQMYAGPNMTCVGKDPAELVNRHLGWSSVDAPFWWIEYKADIVGMPFFWLHTTAPEWAVMEINVDLPIAVYWRLARCYPDLVVGNTINTGEIRGEYLRVLDQGRGIDNERVIGSHQSEQFPKHHHLSPWTNDTGSPLTNSALNAGTVAENGGADVGFVDSSGTGAIGVIDSNEIVLKTTETGGNENLVRNVARSMAIAI